MLDSFTFVEHDKLAKAIDLYEDAHIIDIMNRWIKNAEETRKETTWFRTRRSLTLDESLDRNIEGANNDWDTPSYSIKMVQRQAKEFRRLLKSGNGAYIGARDSFILLYIE